MRRCLLLGWSLLLLSAWGAQEPLIVVEVVNELGEPVSGAYVTVYALAKDGQIGSQIADPHWRTTDANGKAIFTPLKLDFADDPDNWMFKSYPKWELRAVAVGYLPLKQVIEQPQRGTTVRAVLKRGGRPLTLTLRNETGKPLPEPLELAVCEPNLDTLFEEYEVAPALRWVITRKVYSQFSIEPIGEGRYRVLLPESQTEPLLVIVYHAGFLRGFYATLDAEAIRRGEATFTLPKAHTLTIRYDVERVDPKLFKNLELGLTGFSQRAPTVEGIPIGWAVFAKPVEGKGEVRFDDLPPGEYLAEVSGFPASGEGALLNVRKRFELRDGQSQIVELVYNPPDPRRYQGDREHTVRLTGADGKPAVRKPFRLTTNTEAGETVVVQEGETDDAGRAHLKQLKPEVFYQLEVDGRPTSVSFVIGRDDFAPPNEGYIAPQKGDHAPDVPLQPVEGDKPLRLSDLRGKWVYIDFWASWCGPCRMPLAMLAEELPNLKTAHRNRAVVLTVSIDDSTEPIKPYLSQLGLWEHGGHYWAGEGGWRSPVAQRFVVFSIPQAVLIDPNGVIVWRGYPTGSVAALLSEHMGRVK